MEGNYAEIIHVYLPTYQIGMVQSTYVYVLCIGTETLTERTQTLTLYLLPFSSSVRLAAGNSTLCTCRSASLCLSWYIDIKRNIPKLCMNEKRTETARFLLILFQVLWKKMKRGWSQDLARRFMAGAGTIENCSRRSSELWKCNSQSRRSISMGARENAPEEPNPDRRHRDPGENWKISE